MLPERLVAMANQIGKFFGSQETHGDASHAAAAIADHLRRFWDPRMRGEIIAFVEGGGEGLDPLPRAAVERLAAEQAERG